MAVTNVLAVIVSIEIWKFYQQKGPKSNTVMTSYLYFFFIILSMTGIETEITAQQKQQRERERQSGSTFTWSDGAHQMINEYIFHRV